jgi:hypothetical protein
VKDNGRGRGGGKQKKMVRKTTTALRRQNRKIKMEYRERAKKR